MTSLPRSCWPEGHVIARVKGGITLPFQDTPDKGWLPDGSRTSWLNAPSGKKEDRLPVRVAEHSVLVTGPDGEEVSETCTLVTTFLDELAVPAAALREAYPAEVDRVGDDVRRGQGDDHRRREPHLRARAPLWLPAARLAGSLGLARRHPARPRR